MDSFERYGIITDNGGELVEIQNLADGDTCWARRSRLRRFDGAWLLITDRQYDLLMATRKRQAAKTAKAAESKTEVAA